MTTERPQSAPAFIEDPVLRAASTGSGTLPEGGFAHLVPEFGVTDLTASLAFWCGLIGFTIAYDRPAGRFAYLVRGPLQVMLCQLNGRWEPGAIEYPFGRGLNFQMQVDRLAPIVDALTEASWPLCQPPTEAWYRAGPVETGQIEFLVQDPDGYLLRFIEDLGQHEPTQPE